MLICFKSVKLSHLKVKLLKYNKWNNLLKVKMMWSWIFPLKHFNVFLLYHWPATEIKHYFIPLFIFHWLLLVSLYGGRTVVSRISWKHWEPQASPEVDVYHWAASTGCDWSSEVTQYSASHFKTDDWNCFGPTVGRRRWNWLSFPELVRFLLKILGMKIKSDERGRYGEKVDLFLWTKISLCLLYCLYYML